MLCELLFVTVTQGKAQWSPADGGLTARIEVERRGEKAGTPKLVPYLLLRNATDSIGTVDIFLSRDNLKLWLEDETGKDLKDGGAGINGRNGFVPGPFWLQLPYDSVIRMNAGLEGYFSPPPGRLLLETDSALLYLPKDFKGKAFLAGTFTVKDPPHEARSMRWEGTLKLPPVMIFDGKTIVTSPASR